MTVPDPGAAVTPPAAAKAGEAASAAVPEPQVPFAPMPYDQFITERRAIVDARQRAQQRIDQIIAGGAAGALVLSITFLDNIAPTPPLSTKPVLVAAWCALLASLTCNFLGHYASQRAFDRFLEAFDEAFVKGVPCASQTRAGTVPRILDAVSSCLFIGGVALLAWFAYLNLPFKEATADATRPTAVAGRATASPAATTATQAPDPAAGAGAGRNAVEAAATSSSAAGRDAVATATAVPAGRTGPVR